MTSLVDAIYIAKYNPFKYGEYFASFYENLIGVDNNILLAQLVVPLCSHPIFSSKLANAVFGEKRTSSIWTIFDGRTKLYDLQERLDGFKDLTEQSLQYCLVNDWLEVDVQNMSISALSQNETTAETRKNAAKLGKLFSGLSVVEIYAFLGVTPR